LFFLSSVYCIGLRGASLIIGYHSAQAAAIPHSFGTAILWNLFWVLVLVLGDIYLVILLLGQGVLDGKGEYPGVYLPFDNFVLHHVYEFMDWAQVASANRQGVRVVYNSTDRARRKEKSQFSVSRSLLVGLTR